MPETFPLLQAALADRYTIQRELGRGGMAVVYLAEDLKHRRAVAIKVLKPELSARLGADRFLHEIRVTANLQHPHILQLYDSGAADGLLYYVMSYVEGESLRDRLQREGQLPVEDTVRIIARVATALDFAHRQGVVHRDIKPENILLLDGEPLVADFGIALAVSAAGGSRLTETGLSLGTPQYMSPEQAAGERQITGRSDIYSLAVVAYECLVGEPPFRGPSAAAVLARAVTEKPRSMSAMRDTVPPPVEAAILRALAKVPADRFARGSDFAAAVTSPDAADALVSTSRQKAALWRLSVVRGGALAAVALGGLLLGRRLASREAVSEAGVPSRRTSIVLPDTAPLTFVGAATRGVAQPALTLAPDASVLVYVARRGSGTQLYRRRLDAPDVAAMPGTEGAYHPFFSRDGEWVGFFVGYELRKVAVSGGQPVTLAQVPEPAGAAWSDDGRILVAYREGTQYGWVSASGGDLERLPRLDGFNRSYPAFLPGERWVLQSMQGQFLSVTSLESGEVRILTSGKALRIDSTEISQALRGSDARYLPSGHIVYVAGGIVMAAPFDAPNLRTLGPPVPILDGVRVEAGAGVAQLTVAGDGTMVFAPGSDAGVTRPVWRQHNGRIDTLALPARRYGHFDLSPDGHRLAMTVVQATGSSEIWIADLESGQQTRPLTAGEAVLPFWWPDSRRIVFTELDARLPPQPSTVRELPAGGGLRDTLTRGRLAISVSNDGTLMPTFFGSPPGLVLRHVPDTGKGITIDPFPNAVGGALSPDGRWVAYVSNESGRYEVYAVAADGKDERIKISTLGGDEPVWSALGTELMYRNDQQWFAVSVPRAGRSQFGQPRYLFEGPFVQVPGRSYDVAPDGRHLLLVGPPDESSSRLDVVTGWFDDIARRTRVQDKR